MAQTYSELQDQIAKLQAEAQLLRQQELASVIAKMRADIQAYDITPKDLFGKTTAKAASSKAKLPSSAKFSDGKGNSWVGRGPRPQWLRDALAAGKKLEDFVAGEQAAPAQSPESAKAVKPSSKKVSTKKAAPKKARGTAAAK